MSPDHQEFMYEKFTKEMLSNTGLYKGLGFGLPIVKQFIDEMNAEINVISDKGIGTKFSFNIPFKLPLAEIL
jgi:signal transduction histidine kinase